MSDVVALRWPHLGGHGLDAFVTGRDGGVSEGAYASLNLSLGVGDDPGRVLDNRRRAAAAAGVELSDLVFAHQVHGRDVAVLTDADRGRGTVTVADAPAADALVTATPGLGIAVLVGDCVPIVLYDPDARVVAAVHAGWRGTVARVTDAALDAMAALGAEAARVRAGVGPAITADRYQVGDDVADAARACFRAARRCRRHRAPRRHRPLDLRPVGRQPPPAGRGGRRPDAHRRQPGRHRPRDPVLQRPRGPPMRPLRRDRPPRRVTAAPTGTRGTRGGSSRAKPSSYSYGACG